jgi:hypothetical protein
MALLDIAVVVSPQRHYYCLMKITTNLFNLQFGNRDGIPAHLAIGISLVCARKKTARNSGFLILG